MNFQRTKILRRNIIIADLCIYENNWVLLMQVVKYTVIAAMTFVAILQQDKFLWRAVIFVLDFVVFHLLEKGIKKYNLVANYSGIIVATIMYVQMTEVNLKFAYFRINEGYLIQISMSLVFSTCVTTSWKIACLNQSLLHMYGLVRLKNKFGTLTDYYYPGSFCALAFFIFGAYSYSNTLKQEFIANYKKRRTLQGQRGTLNCIPEGVLIVNKDKKYKYANPKIKETFDIKSFYKSDAARDEIKATQIHIDRELDKIIKKYSFCNSNSHLKDPNSSDEFLNGFLKRFRVKCSGTEFNQNIFDQSFGVDKSDEHSQMSKFSEYRHGKSTLAQFLERERKSIMEDINLSKESTISMEYKSNRDNYETQTREFVVKTTIVDADNVMNTDTLFMHMFVETTQISQLEEAKAQNHYQRQMLSNVSHEFRTPLNSIVASLELMRMHDYGEHNRLVRIASSSCSILTMLVEDILDHAKIESGVFQINNEIFTMTQCLQEIQEVFVLQARGKGLELIIEMEDKLKELPVQSDKGRLKQVLMNLVSNALKFTDRGAITIQIHEKHPEQQRRPIEESKSFGGDQLRELSFEHVRDEDIEYLSEASNLQEDRHNCSEYFFHTNRSRFRSIEHPQSEFTDTMQISLKVVDTGIGISKADQKSLFKLFGKLSSNHDRNKTGCGLGLTICKKLIEKLGGEISLYSEENVGTTVECHFTCKY
ncbi:unnamed protein product [Moneuplotes crassus]|uniref:histidine kinase n=1 Tax=Euplotes crassus TaxID=5936 RepID=A0AAD2D1Q1_EUPCR|nr:unnamed protein product [Moneuplotes crassus]